MAGWASAAARAALPAVIVVCALASAAAADSTAPVVIRPGGNITSNGSVTFESEIGVRIVCNVSLSGTFASGTIEATLPEPIGSVSRASATGCSGGTVTPLAEARAPWGIYVNQALGTLPEAVTGMSVRLSPVLLLGSLEGFVACLFTSTLGGLLELRLVERTRSTYRTGSIRLLTEEQQTVQSSIVRLSGIFGCPTRPTAAGSLSLTAQEFTAQPPAVLPLTAENTGIQFTGAASHTYYFRNTSGANVGPMGAATLTLPLNQGFSIPAENDRCRGITLTTSGATQRCEVIVVYNGVGALPRMNHVYIRTNVGVTNAGAFWVAATRN
jgi:hypothetical protein